MSSADAVRKGMMETGLFKEKDLEFITDEYIERVEKEAVDISKEFTLGEYLTFGVTSGNHFFIKGNAWYWENSPGSQCGRTRLVGYIVKPGASWRPAGNCPQGYPWVELNLI